MKNLFFVPLGKNVRSQNFFGKKQHSNNIYHANFIQFGPKTTEQSSCEIGAKSALILTKCKMLTNAHMREGGYLKCSREHPENPNIISNLKFVLTVAGLRPVVNSLK